MRLVLASESARRVDLLRAAGFDFETTKSGFPEVTLADPRETVLVNARGKALAVAGDADDAVVLAADTVVYLPDEGALLGQAGSGEEVRRMLLLLRGRAHEVHSGVAVATEGKVAVRPTCGSGRAWGRRGATPYRAGRRRSWSGSGATTQTWWGCR